MKTSHVNTVAGEIVTAQTTPAVLWVDDNEVVEVHMGVVPIGFTDEPVGGVAIVLVGGVNPDGTSRQKPLLALDKDGAKVLLAELMRHVDLGGAQ